jgi:hypothetical protein
MRELIVRRYLCRGPVHRHAVSRRHCGTSQRAERHVLRLMAPAAVTLLCRTGHVQIGNSTNKVQTGRSISVLAREI